MKVRRGSIYVVTMSTALIVAVLATTALTTTRVQRRSSQDVTNMRQALVHAESAMEFAQYQMMTSATWRSQLASNTWAADRVIADGYFNFVGSDPLDNNLLNFNYDPVEILATGKQGSCIHKLRGTVQFAQPGLDCLGSGVHAREDLIIDNATLNNYVAPCSSNTQIVATNFARVNSNCESSGNVSALNNALLNGTNLPNQALKIMPSGNDILNYYLTRGTTIPVTSLPLWDRNFLLNPGAEVDLANWAAFNCSISRSTNRKKSGAYSFEITDRSSINSYMYQDITSRIVNEVNYYFGAWVFVDANKNTDSFRIKVQVDATGGNVTYTSAWIAVPRNSWTLVSGTGNITWSGTLQSARWYVESLQRSKDYFLDDLVMSEGGTEPDTRVVHRALLSPQINSLTNIPNSDGIYVIDCQGETVNVQDTRILGTLVLRNPGDSSRIEGSMHCESATANSTNPNAPNLLTLITDKKIKIALSSANLDERLTNRNFNPSGAPYQGAVDSDTTDVYPSQINGVIYSLDHLEFGGTTIVNGVVISDKKVEIRGTNPLTTSLTVNYNGLYRYVNPPVEFRDTPIVFVKPGSVSRVVD